MIQMHPTQTKRNILIAKESYNHSLFVLTFNGAKETRTPDPLHAMQVLYQLSYGPNASRRPWPSLRRVEAYNVTPPMA